MRAKESEEAEHEKSDPKKHETMTEKRKKRGEGIKEKQKESRIKEEK